MGREDDGLRIDTWAEIEELIAREAENKFAAQMLDVDRARSYALEFAATTVRTICSILGGQTVYVPYLARHHREERDRQICMNFHGVCKDSAREVGLSVRQTRRIVGKKVTSSS